MTLKNIIVNESSGGSVYILIDGLHSKITKPFNKID